MKFNPKQIKRFQMGGEMAPEEVVTEETVTEEVPTEAPEQQDPMMMLAQASMQALQNQDCNMAMQVCQAFLQLIQQAQQQAAPVNQGEPVFAKNGAKLVRRIRK